MTTTAPDIQSIASRHGFSPEAVLAAWNALRRGNGSMAQFNHQEFGGIGQWFPGMIMIGDMFNNGLKSRVESLFNDLRNQPEASHASPPPQNSGASLSYGSAVANAGKWYPAELGIPSSAGSQNNVRYAYFPETHRLAIELFGNVTLYETGTHVISGVSQSQSNDVGSITFTSQFGVIPVSNLQIVG